MFGPRNASTFRNSIVVDPTARTLQRRVAAYAFAFSCTLQACTEPLSLVFVDEMAISKFVAGRGPSVTVACFMRSARRVGIDTQPVNQMEGRRLFRSPRHADSVRAVQP